MEKLNVRNLFSKGKEMPENILVIVKQICLLDEKTNSIIASHMKRVYAGEELPGEDEERREKQTQLLHQIEKLLGLDTDYVDEEHHKVWDSDIFHNMAEFLPHFEGPNAEFFILPNGVVLDHSFYWNWRLMFFENLEKASPYIIQTVNYKEEEERRMMEDR